MENGVRVLIVKDGHTQAEQLRFTLEHNSYPISTACNGKEALALMNSRKTAVVISDIVMSEMDGYELCRQIRANANLKGIPVILLTALSGHKSVIKSLECGANNFIVKPLNLAGIPLRSLAFFAGAFGIGIGFGMQNIISNFVSGIILLFKCPIRVGDVVSLEDGTLGTVDKFSVKSTSITTPDGITLRVPNSKFIESRITNLSHPTPQVRGCVKAKVVYGSNTSLVKNCLLEVAKKNSNVRVYPEPVVRFAEFGPTALIFELYFWSDDPEKRWFTISELNFTIDEMFQKNNILLHP